MGHDDSWFYVVQQLHDGIYGLGLVLLEACPLRGSNKAKPFVLFKGGVF